VAEAGPRPRVPDHPLIPREHAPVIADPDDVAEIVEHIRGEGSFAYDTEFIGEETYHPLICLIQVATRERIALVDPLAGVDPAPIFELVADPAIETIVHAGEQDLEPVVRCLDRAPANIFDTQVAAGFVNRPYPLGLRRLVEEFAGVRLGKALTFTEWDKRPLSDVHAQYAADDVRYLPAVREAIGKELEQLDHASWSAEECGQLEATNRFRFDPDARLARIIGNRNLRPRCVAVLRELLVLRDQAARDRDMPPQTFLKDDVLVRIAKDPPRTLPALDAVKGLPRPVVERHGREILDAVEQASSIPPGELPRRLSMEELPADRVRIDSLWALARSFCLGRAIDPALVGNRRAVAEFYFATRNGTAPETTALMSGWRGELVGDLLRDVLDAGATVELRWEDGRLRAESRR
jgi:ribonuclease D